MYNLTPRMLQKLSEILVGFHQLFDGDRCSGWQLEEVFVQAIKSDTSAQHHIVDWREGGHDDKADIVVRINGTTYHVQIKSGKISQDKLTLSGHRLMRFKGDLGKITAYLNNPKADLIATPYKKIDDSDGRKHTYKICYVEQVKFTGLAVDKWKKKGEQYQQTNSEGVEFSLRPSMSWQVWWNIPISLIKVAKEINID